MMPTTFSQFSQRTAIYSGAGARSLIPDLFRGFGARRVVLFSDRGLEQAGVVDMVAELFGRTTNGAGPELVGIYLDIDQDATSSSVNQALRYAREMGADSLLAVGGGSVLDTVKGVKYALHLGIHDIREAIPSGLNLVSWPHASYIPIPHIAVPTTAGTGSEVSPIAVFFNESMRIKANLIHPFINADMAVLDPELTVGLPPRITAFTGFDALTHAIEALASPRATPFTDSYALHAIRLIMKYLPEAVANGSNLEARMRMLQASTMAIVAFGMSLSLVPIHNFAHAYGALFRIPHGLANAVFLPVVMESMPHLYLPRIVEYAQAFGLETGHRDPQKLLDDVIQTIRQMQQEVGLPSTFTEYNITADDLPKIVAAVVSDPTAVFFRLPPELITAVGQKVAGLTAASAEHSA